jgi:hypothetical protein
LGQERCGLPTSLTAADDYEPTISHGQIDPVDSFEAVQAHRGQFFECDRGH